MNNHLPKIMTRGNPVGWWSSDMTNEVIFGNNRDIVREESGCWSSWNGWIRPDLSDSLFFGDLEIVPIGA